MNGYISIDCKGLNLLADSAQTINGMYDDVQAAIKTGKPIYATNMVWGEVSDISPVQVFTVQFDGYVICTASTLQVIVTTEDSVTINNLAPTNTSKSSKSSK
jgi:hypothetical protein